jgi:lysophospholipase L1-like esterase
MQQTLILLQDNWDTLARQLRQTAPPRAKIITINQYDPYLYQNAATSNFITLANQALTDICAKYNITVIDAYTICHQPQYFSKDKLHLNQAGYTRLFQAINRALHPTIISRLKNVLNKALW